MNFDWQRIWKVSIVMYFKMLGLPLHLPGENEETHGKSVTALKRPVFDPDCWWC